MEDSVLPHRRKIPAHCTTTLGGCNIVCEIYKDGFDAFSLQTQLKPLPEFLKGSNCLLLSESIDFFKELPAPLHDHNYQFKWSFKIDKVDSGGSSYKCPFWAKFSALKLLKTKMRSTMHSNHLNHLMILHVYQAKIEKIYIREIVNKFISRKDSREERFSLL